MAKQSKKTTDKPADDRTDLESRLESLGQEYREQLQQLRLGASSNVRKPRQIRREIARAKTRLSMLNLPVAENEPETAKNGAGK